MKRIMTKLRSQKGASLILALLFFLLCIMVGASVLAAASSNAGKARERRKEQQEYFAVSSALQLVCNRLAKAEYKAMAEVSSESVTELQIAGDPSTEYTYQKTTYKQQNGTVTFDTNTGIDGKWKTILPALRKELDYLFADRFKEEKCNGYHGNGKFPGDDVHTHSTSGGGDVSSPTEHTLTIKVDDTTTSLPVDALEELKKEVEVKISLGKHGAVGEEKYWFFLEAKLIGGKGKFVMKAELKPKPMGSSGNVFPHINEPDTYNGKYPGQLEERATLQWELVRIYRAFF